MIDADVVGLSAGCFHDCLPTDVTESLLPRWLQETSPAEFEVCPEYGRVEFLPEELRQWRFDLDAVAASVASSLSLSGSVSTAIPQQLWKLGRSIWQNKSRDLWFVRGLGQLDEIQLTTVLRSGLRRILLISGDVPEEPLWKSRPPALVLLSQVSQWCDSQFTIDRLQFLEHVADQDQRIAERTN